MLDLDAIQARANAATPGPWRWGGYLRGPIFLLSMAQWRPYVMQFCRLGMQGAQPIFRKPNPNLGYSEWAKATDVAVREVHYRDDIERMDNPDAEFIAHARTDVPSLVAELRAAREAITDMRDFIDRSHAREGAPRGDDYWHALTVARASLRTYHEVTGEPIND